MCHPANPQQKYLVQEKKKKKNRDSSNINIQQTNT